MVGKKRQRERKLDVSAYKKEETNERGCRFVKGSKEEKKEGEDYLKKKVTRTS